MVELDMITVDEVVGHFRSEGNSGAEAASSRASWYASEEAVFRNQDGV